MKALVSMIVCFILSVPVLAIQPKNSEWVKLSRDELKSELEKLKGKKDRVKDRVDLRNLLAYKLSSYNHKAAKKYAEVALAVSKEIDYTDGFIDSLNNLGVVHERKGESESAKRKSEKAFEEAERINYEIGQAQALLGLVRYYQTKGLFDMAFTLAFKSKYILEKITIKNPLVNRTLASCYHSLGVIYFYDRNTFEKSREYFQKSLELGEKVGDKDYIGVAYYSMGEISHYMEEYKEALDYFDRSLKIGKSTGNTYIIANVYQGMADVFRKWNYKTEFIDETKWVIKIDFNKALDYYAQSEKLFAAIGDRFQIASTLRNKGICLKEMQQYGDAKVVLEKALALAREIDNPHTIETIAQELKTVYAKLGNKDKVDEYYFLAQNKKDFLEANSMVSISFGEEAAGKLKNLKIKLFLLITLSLTILALLLTISFFLLRSKRANKELEIQKEELKIQKEKVEKSLNDIKLLNDIGKEIISSLSIEYIIDKVYENVIIIMDAESFGIGIHNPKTEELDFVGKERGENLPPYSTSLSEKGRMSIQCFIEQKHIITQNYSKEYIQFSDVKPEPPVGQTYNSHIFLPLTLQTEKGDIKMIGVITVQSPKIGAYNEYQLTIFQNIANYAAIALDNANTVEQLKEALEKEKELGSLKDQFMYTVSHQYKTPLTNIDIARQFLEKYQTGISGEELTEELAVISRNVHRMQELIDELFQFGRTFNPGFNDLDKLLCKIVDGSKLGNGKEHQILFNSDGKVSKAFIDEELIKILFNNLITNSIKYSGKGSQIKVTLEAVGSDAVIKVKDYGRGIPEDILNLKDKRFHRGSNALKDTNGTGLGLSIVEHYAGLHGGTVRYDSRLNEGTIVTVTLPLRQTRH